MTESKRVDDIDWREIDPEELDARRTSVHEAIRKLREAQTVSQKTLQMEINAQRRD